MLIALALSAWWNGVQDGRIEARSLREVRASLANDLSDMQINVAYHQLGASSPFYDMNFKDIEPLQSATPVNYTELSNSTRYRALFDWSEYPHTLLAAAEGALAEAVMALIGLIDDVLAGR